MYKQITKQQVSMTDTKAVQQVVRRTAWRNMIQAQAMATKATFQPFAYQGE